MYVRGGQAMEVARTTWPRQLAILAIASGMTALELEVLKGVLTFPPLIVTILGTALAFFIGFINNQAYDRWWEARKIWGALVNDSRNFGMMVKAYFDLPEGAVEANMTIAQQRLVHRHIGFLKAAVNKLRGAEVENWEAHLQPEERESLERFKSKPIGIATLQREAIAQARTDGYIDGFELMALNRTLDGFIDDLGKAERIKSTVFPLGHVHLTQVSLWLFIVLLPATLASMVGYWAIAFTWVLGFLYVLTFNAGQSIVDPFENRPSDTPISSITRTIEIDLRDILAEHHDLGALKTMQGTHKM